jgi:hypothetical protein
MSTASNLKKIWHWLRWTVMSPRERYAYLLVRAGSHR